PFGWRGPSRRLYLRGRVLRCEVGIGRWDGAGRRGNHHRKNPVGPSGSHHLGRKPSSFGDGDDFTSHRRGCLVQTPTGHTRSGDGLPLIWDFFCEKTPSPDDGPKARNPRSFSTTLKGKGRQVFWGNDVSVGDFLSVSFWARGLGGTLLVHSRMGGF